MNRKNLETYNRVPVLESLFARRILTAGQILLLAVALAALAGYFLLPQSSTPTIMILVVAPALLLTGLLHMIEGRRRKKHCRFCGAPLDSVLRPLLLTSGYLSMEGRKVGSYFFTRKRQGWFGPNRWVRLSHQTLACHHCRLTEEAYRVVQETPSPAELQQLDSPS